jgi:hypothetical protein
VGERRGPVGVRVGADREEGGIAEVEQAGQPHDDVEAHRQQHPDAGLAKPSTKSVWLKAGERRQQDDERQERVTIDMPTMTDSDWWAWKNRLVDRRLLSRGTVSAGASRAPDQERQLASCSFRQLLAQDAGRSKTSTRMRMLKTMASLQRA